jgi:hypothetical protein
MLCHITFDLSRESHRHQQRLPVLHGAQRHRRPLDRPLCRLAIVEEYRKDCWTTGEYMTNPRLREAAMRKILQLSQVYTADDAEKLLNRAAGKPLPPGKQKPSHRIS